MDLVINLERGKKLRNLELLTGGKELEEGVWWAQMIFVYRRSSCILHML